MFNIINMRCFLDEPDREFGVREYARIQKIAPATASKRLRELAKEKLVTYRRDRNVLLYKANEVQAYRDLKIYDNVKRIRASGIIDYLNKEFRRPVIYLFGSYAKGENRKRSDIDIFVLTRTKKVVDVKIFERKLAPIQLFVYMPKDVSKTNPHLLNNVINGVRLSGFWEVF